MISVGIGAMGDELNERTYSVEHTGIMVDWHSPRMDIGADDAI